MGHEEVDLSKLSDGARYRLITLWHLYWKERRAYEAFWQVFRGNIIPDVRLPSKKDTEDDKKKEPELHILERWGLVNVTRAARRGTNLPNRVQSIKVDPNVFAAGKAIRENPSLEALIESQPPPSTVSPSD